MKRSFHYVFIVGTLLSFSNLFSQEDKSSLGRVKKINGTEIYAMSEPLREYDVVFDLGGLLDIKSNVKAKSLLTAGLVTENISDKLNQLVNRANEKATKNMQDIDAVIYTNAKTAVAIKFTDELSEDTKGISRVSRINGTRVFVFSEPILDYDVINEKSGKAQKGTSIVTAGIVNSSVEEDVTKLEDKLSKDAIKKGHRLDGLIYSTGKSAVGIRLYK